ncbi:C40 family peptidase [Persicitalea sp.]|uniref:C40 family peptidase n=1 Tax=Persicitalea sp. TaxID=3100273 RepID=UPI0035935900
MKFILLIILLLFFSACRQESTTSDAQPPARFEQETTLAQEIVKYAQTLRDIPYKYATSDPEVGFDCSGFVNHVYGQFGVEVPRSSVNFKEAGPTVLLAEAEPGDIVLFTGTNPDNRRIGHLGIVVKNDEDGINFIHSTSGKQYSVVLTPLLGHYERRFVKVIRVL